jgi:hypothetical protein
MSRKRKQTQFTISSITDEKLNKLVKLENSNRSRIIEKLVDMHYDEISSKIKMV